MSDIFLSYASEDRERVRPVVGALEARGWSVWWDRTIKPGQIFARVIQAALEEARCVVVLWSRESVESDWVQTEAAEGQKRKILIPALLDDVAIPLEFRRIHAAKLDPGFGDLLGGVERILGMPAAPPRLTAGQTRENPKDGLTYVWIPPGKFTMGCSPGDNESFPGEKPAHEVTITLGFWMGQTPVTEAAYARYAKANGQSIGPADTDLPVVNVSWEDTQRYCQWVGLRLPSEAEWEYAARAGTSGSRYGALDDVAWHGGNSGGKRHPVCGRQPNAWGLYDILGNVWEWVTDWYNEAYYGQSSATDPSGPSTGQGRVLRGGSLTLDVGNVRASARLGRGTTYRSTYIGFRCAGELP